MSDYWGLDGISRRLAINPSTLLRWYTTRRFLMFQRHRSTNGRKPRRTWYTNDELITRWELLQCATQWRARDAKRQASQRVRALDAPSDGVKRQA